MVVLPLYAFELLIKVTVLAEPIWTTLPFPVMAWLTVVVLPLAWSNTKDPLFTMPVLLAMEPFAEPLPICKVPALMVVVPL